MINLYTSFLPSDWINIAGIIINGIIGVILVVIVSKRISNKRAIKDYFINEIRDIREDYRKFLNDLFCEKYSFSLTNSWFQIMNMKLINLEKALKKDNTNFSFEVKELHQSLRDLITDHDDFNNSYKKPHVIISQILKQEVVKKHSEISLALMNTVVKINNK